MIFGAQVHCNASVSCWDACSALVTYLGTDYG